MAGGGEERQARAKPSTTRSRLLGVGLMARSLKWPWRERLARAKATDDSMPPPGRRPHRPGRTKAAMAGGWRGRLLSGVGRIDPVAQRRPWREGLAWLSVMRWPRHSRASAAMARSHRPWREQLQVIGPSVTLLRVSGCVAAGGGERGTVGGTLYFPRCRGAIDLDARLSQSLR